MVPTLCLSEPHARLVSGPYTWNVTPKPTDGAATGSRVVCAVFRLNTAYDDVVCSTVGTSAAVPP